MYTFYPRPKTEQDDPVEMRKLFYSDADIQRFEEERLIEEMQQKELDDHICPTA